MFRLFSEWLIEGKALMLNEDQRAFAREVSQAMKDWIENTPDDEKDKLPGLPLSNYDYEDFPIIYEREVYGNKDPKTGVSRQMHVAVHMAASENPYQGAPSAYADAYNVEFDRGRMMVCVQRWTQTSQMQYTLPKGLEGVIEHELVHIFDPKFNPAQLPSHERDRWKVQQTFSSKVGTTADAKGDLHYGQTPWEQDAGMYQRARRTIQKYKDRGWEFDGKHMPQDDWERAWKTRPEQWKKYLRTLYHMAKEEGLI